MLQVILPDPTRIAAIQERDESYYWSAYLPFWLRKWGLLEVQSSDAFAAVARGATTDDLIAQQCAGIYEGPLEENVLQSLGLTVRNLTARDIYLKSSDPERSLNGPTFGRPRENVRRIPRKPRETSLPYLHVATDRLIGDEEISVQLFRPVDGWRPLAHAHLDGTGHTDPIVITNGRMILMGLPLFDLLAQAHWMAPLPAGYYSMERGGTRWTIERWLCALIRAAALDSGCGLVTVDHWPQGFRSALSIRHDHDRPITDAMLEHLLSFYRSSGVKASWGFLARLMPMEQMRAIDGAGHEIVLHTEANSGTELAKEVRQIERAIGCRPMGVTCHGGMGSPGYLGEYLYHWVSDARLGYTELLGRENLLPHPLLTRDGGRVVAMDVMVPPTHMSLDRTTAAHDHCLDDLRKSVPEALAAGGHANVMNHPDIHIPELKQLINGLDLDGVWLCTHHQSVEWAKIVKFGSKVVHDGDAISVRFAQPLPAAATYRFERNGVSRSWQIPPGSEEFSASISHDGGPIDEVRISWKAHSSSPKVSSEGQSKSDGAPGQRSIAVILPHATEAAQAVDSMRSRGAFGFDAPNPHILCLEGGTAFADASFLHASGKGMFDEVIVSPSITLLDGNWSRAFLRALSNIVTDRGRIVLRSKYPLHRRLFGDIMSGREVESCINAKRMASRNIFSVYQKQGRTAGPQTHPSVLDWYVQNADSLVTLDAETRMSARGLPQELDSEICREFVVQNDLGALAAGRLSTEPIEPSAYAEARKVAVGSHAYLVAGLSSKGRVLNRIVADQFRTAEGLSFLDVGGGFGGLAAELLLTDNKRYAKAVTRDYSSLHLALATELYSGMHDRLRGRFFFSPGDAHTFRYTERFNIVSFIGVLLYLREHLDHVLKSAWDALTPGGVLVVHENIRTAANTVDFNKMFASDELDSLLARFGELAYYHPDSRLRLPGRLVGNRTVFRVVRKR